VLATVETGKGRFADLAEAVLLGAARISGVLCVLLAWDAARRELVARLRGRGIPVRVWIVRDGSDAAPLDPGPMASDIANFRTVDASSLQRELLRG